MRQTKDFRENKGFEKYYGTNNVIDRGIKRGEDNF